VPVADHVMEEFVLRGRGEARAPIQRSLHRILARPDDFASPTRHPTDERVAQDG
jgi:hypothetical protein